MQLLFCVNTRKYGAPGHEVSKKKEKEEEGVPVRGHIYNSPYAVFSLNKELSTHIKEKEKEKGKMEKMFTFFHRNQFLVVFAKFF